MLTTDLERGGLPLRVAKLAPRLRDFGVEPVVGCLAPPGPLSAELERQGVRTFSCAAAGPFDATCLIRLARHVRGIDPDLVHASLFHANLAARLICRLDCPRPIITSTVTIEIERLWHRWLESATAGLTDVHVANSRAVADHLMIDLGFPADRVVVMPNAIDLAEIDATPPIDRRAAGLQDGAQIILWAGRMDPVKDLPIFVSVIERLRDRANLIAVLLGDGPDRHRIEACVARAGVGGLIRFKGWSHEVVAWLKAADLLLFPSRTEGCPNVVLEAMASGCPVVAGDVPGCRELIDSGIDGLLCPVGDVEAFAAAVEHLLCDIPKAKRIVGAARTKALARNDLNQAAERWARLYQSLV